MAQTMQKSIFVTDGGFKLQTIDPNGIIIDAIEYGIGKLFDWITNEAGNAFKYADHTIDENGDFLILLHPKFLGIFNTRPIALNISKFLKNLGYSIVQVADNRTKEDNQA